jgi:hypothetical protein
MPEVKALGDNSVPRVGGSEEMVTPYTSGWSRTWTFFIWTWTITTWDNDCYVETIQHRFLGQVVIHRYGKVLWMVVAISAIALGMAGMVCLWLLAYMVSGVSNLDPITFLWFGLLSLLMALGSIVIAYFTFVPPRHSR